MKKTLNTADSIKRPSGAQASKNVALVAAAYFLSTFLISFRMNPAGDFLSTLEMTPLSAIFHVILFAVSLVFVFLVARFFPKVSARLILLTAIQAFVAMSALRSGETSFVFGALLVGVAILFQGLVDWSSFRAFNVHAQEAKTENGGALPEEESSPDGAVSTRPGDDGAASLDTSTSRIHRALFVLLFVFTALIPLGFLSNLLFFTSPERAPKPFEFFGTSSGSLWIGALGAAVLIAFIYVPLNREKKGPRTLEKSPGLRALLFLAALIPALFLMVIMVARIASFFSPTYDMGIFTQMFHSMKTTGAPITTLERDMPLSHFHIHMSPVFYLLLPFYAIFPSPETLQVLQVLVVLSGVIPLYLLSKKYFKTGKTWRLVFSALYVMQPTLLGSNLYDLHENCFLAPMTLWLIYACHRRSTALVMLFGALTLMVKEDAALYVIAVALFTLFGGIASDGRKERKKDVLHSVLLIVGSVVYFGWAVTYLNSKGLGVMTYRFDNLIVYKNLGTLGVIPAMLQNPAYYLTMFWTPEKMQYLLIVLGSLGFLPLFQKKGAHYFLVVPLVVMNLASYYAYQFDLSYQYHFGSGALLVFMAMMAAAHYRMRIMASLTPDGARLTASPQGVALLADERSTSVPDDTVRTGVNPTFSVPARKSASSAKGALNLNTTPDSSKPLDEASEHPKASPPPRKRNIARAGLREPSFVIRASAEARSEVPPEAAQRPLSGEAEREGATSRLNRQSARHIRSISFGIPSNTPKDRGRDRDQSAAVRADQARNPAVRAGGNQGARRDVARTNDANALAVEVSEEIAKRNDVVQSGETLGTAARENNGADAKALSERKPLLPDRDAAETARLRVVMRKRVLAILTAFALLCALFQSAWLLSERSSAIRYETNHRQQLNDFRRCLDAIPKEASVGATTFMTTYLADRDVLYDLKYHERPIEDGHLEYLVFDLRWAGSDERSVIEKALEAGYVKVEGTPDQLMILKWPT